MLDVREHEPHRVDERQRVAVRGHAGQLDVRRDGRGGEDVRERVLAAGQVDGPAQGGAVVLDGDRPRRRRASGRLAGGHTVASRMKAARS
ncbi:hypothetical protein Cch01nite_13270 [Cellulomonas chitinilytica]|uniref:Uncharacterized protein n=1 Tax=Cellulomonas chitinilytica TaxID=398759 RepID=A0A919TZ89_9CELL|nr:hypothetical protein Cch01nite_13270 [Cellulomonas chitinilytica]